MTIIVTVLGYAAVVLAIMNLQTRTAPRLNVLLLLVGVIVVLVSESHRLS